MRNILRLLTATVLVAIAGSFGVADTYAQTVSGVVVDSISGEPVVGALLRAVAPGDVTVAATLTNGSGAWSIDAGSDPPPAYLQLRRLGYANQSFEIPAGAPGGAPIVLRAVAEAIRLAGVSTGPPQCGTILADTDVSTIWSEVRKALEMSEVGARTAVEGYEVERSFRALDLDASQVLGDSTIHQIVTAASPYRTLSVEKMSNEGWIERDEASSLYFAPDASLLLSEEFERQHCFGALTYGDSVVLRFEPTRERARLPDIEGEIVLGGEPLDLRQLRFRYVGRGVVRSRGIDPHGEVSFFTAPNGLRVVREWWIRVPIERFSLRGIVGLQPSHVMEEGGRVTRLLLRPGG